MKKSGHGIYQAVFYCLTLGIIALLGYRVFLMALYSLNNINYADSAFLYYLTWLKDSHDVVPFRDVIETSFPGTYWSYALITKFFGYTDSGYRTADLSLFAVFLIMSFFFIRKAGSIAAVVAVLYFSEYYLSDSTLGLQRDYLALFPVVASLLLADSRATFLQYRFPVIGFLFALSCSVKPHFCIGLPFVLWYAASGSFRGDSVACRWFYPVALAAFGFIAGLLFCAVFMLRADAIPGYVEVVTRYLPVYLRLVDVQPGVMQEASWHLGFDEITSIFLMPYFEAIPLAISSLFVFFLHDRSRRIMAVIILLLFSYRLYVLIGVKNFEYHHIPERFFLFAGVAMVAIAVPEKANPFWKIAHLSWLAILFYSVLHSHIDVAYEGAAVNAARLDAKNELVSYLRDNIRPGDGVQPRVQGTYGPVFPAMLALKIPLAINRFPLNQIFYHHTSDPYVAQIQSEYMVAMRTMRPRFIVDDNGFSDYLQMDSYGFPEYDDFIRANYHQVYSNLQRAYPPDQFIVFEKNSP